MYPGNPGGDQVRRNCDWLVGQEVRDVECCGIYLFYLYFDCPAGAGAALLSHLTTEISFSGSSIAVLFLLPFCGLHFISICIPLNINVVNYRKF